MLTRVVTDDEQFDQGPALPQPACQAERAILNECRVARIGDATAFAQCLVEAGASCPHGFVASNFHYCVHPQREAIIRRTLAAEAAPGK
jgi:hypothetical protein